MASLNQLWENNSFPATWRTSTLIPILKPSKLPSDPTSYRPISLTSCASKLFERMVNRRIRVHLESNSLLSPCQNGFRPDHSTADGVVQIINDIQCAFQSRQYTVAVFLDFKAAFDKVNKTALLIKLHQMGFRGRIADYLRNFLQQRTFNVRCGNTYSATFNQDHGLPQGSVISPTLFLVMINDMFNDVSPNLKYSLYADDAAIWFSHCNVTQALNNIQLALRKIQNWCHKWGLQISPAKSAALIFSHGLPRVRPYKLRINEQNIKYVQHFKYLGVTLDKTLNFNKHFEDIRQRCARRINILKCIAGKDWGGDRRTLLRLYTTLIRPILDYNAFLYDEIASNKIDTLQTIQNEALRIVSGAFRTSNTVNIHIDLNVPTLDRRRKYQLIRFFLRSSTRPNNPTYKILTTFTPNILNDAQKKHPLISYRIKRMLDHFQLKQTQPFPSPHLTTIGCTPLQSATFSSMHQRKSSPMSKQCNSS